MNIFGVWAQVFATSLMKSGVKTGIGNMREIAIMLSSDSILSSIPTLPDNLERSNKSRLFSFVVLRCVLFTTEFLRKRNLSETNVPKIAGKMTGISWKGQRGAWRRWRTSKFNRDQNVYYNQLPHSKDEKLDVATGMCSRQTSISYPSCQATCPFSDAVEQPHHAFPDGMMRLTSSRNSHGRPQLPSSRSRCRTLVNKRRFSWLGMRGRARLRTTRHAEEAELHRIGWAEPRLRVFAASRPGPRAQPH